MRTNKLVVGLTVGLALALFACVTGPDDPVASEESQGSGTDTVSAELQRRPVSGTGCGAECTSEDKKETCCCEVGQKCVSHLNSCECKPASRAFGRGGLYRPGRVIARGGEELEPGAP